MADVLWKAGLFATLTLVIYYQMWHQRSTTAKKRYLVISFIGLLVVFGIFTVTLLPEPLAPLILATTITGSVVFIVFSRKFRKS